MEHPITPPPELLQQWAVEYWGNPGESIGEGEKHIAIQAARWGADQELEACCEWLEQSPYGFSVTEQLRTARRPKPLSLNKQAIDALEASLRNGYIKAEDGMIILRALESIPDDEEDAQELLPEIIDTENPSV